MKNFASSLTLYKYFQLCDTSPDNDENSQIYSAPVAELGSTTNLTQCENQENDRNGDKGKLSTTSKKSHSSVAPNKNSRQSEDNVSYCDQIVRSSTITVVQVVTGDDFRGYQTIYHYAKSVKKFLILGVFHQTEIL